MRRKRAEPLSNIRFVCGHCAPRPDPTLHVEALANYVGAYVKLAFREGKWTEHLWVRVTNVQGDGLVGVLTVKPIFVTRVAEGGDTVRFRREDIEQLSWP